jgi:CMP-N,N'-diacetyllegionaminic acid synthase
MYKNKTFLAIIPARGGSKRLPRKNVLNLNGKPLIAYSIEAGLNSKYIDKVIVTSDDDEILAISKKYGVNTIKRPVELSSDMATTSDVIKHTMDNCAKYDYIVLLQPTSPLRTEKHIDKAIEFQQEKNANAVVSVCEVDHHPSWSNALPNDCNMSLFLDNVSRGQDLDRHYRLNGAIYICQTLSFLKDNTLFIESNIYAFKMNRESSIDIDEKIDFQLAELTCKKNT